MTFKNPVPEGYDALEQIKLEMETIDGMNEFTAAARGFIRGDSELDDTTAVMMRFLQGDGYGNADERKRIIELAQTVEARCGWLAVTVSIAACTAAFSCSMACC
ncbi:hypothetical protein [Planomonospora sp. ID82291]|uniref:hypothetical protein n=1 Tax=Planomonospora sp. ID82291 TaxID=2738136 RepID=UPI0018C36025|nr:hypothetical protein [Planomonospora sp. ID82291]MBG0812785.1 hypothetical protein [Planomonospora sp. ID82291]